MFGANIGDAGLIKSNQKSCVKHHLPTKMTIELYCVKQNVPFDNLNSENRMCRLAKQKSNKAIVKFISPAQDHFRETYKSQNKIPISPTPKFTLDIKQIKAKRLSTSSQCLVQ